MATRGSETRRCSERETEATRVRRFLILGSSATSMLPRKEKARKGGENHLATWAGLRQSPDCICGINIGALRVRSVTFSFFIFGSNF